jgi:hypothetical protein
LLLLLRRQLRLMRGAVGWQYGGFLLQRVRRPALGGFRK